MYKINDYSINNDEIFKNVSFFELCIENLIQIPNLSLYYHF